MVLSDSPGTLRLLWGRLPDGAVGSDALGMNAEARFVWPHGGVDSGTSGGYGSGPDRFGLTHCDLRLANLLCTKAN